MNYTFLKAGIFFALLGVLLGAYGAHGLENYLNADQLDSFKTGVRYQNHHSLALILLALLSPLMKNSALLKYAGYLFIIGIVLFSGSVYLLSCRDLLGIQNWRWLGPITPLGGTCFIIGWGLMLLTAIRKK